jgi:anti-sigma regulatory factor (Ser/Thr protein kinase)
VSDQVAAAWLASSVLPPLGALRTAPATARGHVRGTLAAWRLSELSDTIELVVSELAANAVNASAGPDGHPAHLEGRIPVIRVRLFAGEAVLVAEVWDEVGGVPARKNAGAADESGRGLDLVHELTDARWGWYHAPSGPGKCVWAEFPIPSHSGRRRTAAGRIPPVSGMPNGTESGRLRPGRGHERPDLNPIRR